jgi:ketosteroid isomerase-like protein
VLAMSQENVEIVRRDYAAFERGDFSAILDDVDPDVAVQAHPRGDEGKYEGHDGFLRFITEWMQDGKAIKVDLFDNEAHALEAAGLHEQ